MGGSSKKVTVAHRVFLGKHLAMVRGPVDKLVKIVVAARRAWVGESTGGRITINARNLFGGDKREGGISGAVDFEPGHPDQGQNDYLQARFGPDIPAFREVACLVLRQVYLGLNPYPKPWEPWLQRIHTRHDGGVQWYDEKAEIVGNPEMVATETEMFSMPWQFTDTVPGSFEVVGGELRNTQTDLDPPGALFYRPLTNVRLLSRMEFDTVVRVADPADPARLRVRGSGGEAWFTFIPRREVALDPIQRPSFIMGDGAFVFSPIGEDPLPVGVVFRVLVNFDLSARQASIEIRNKATGVLFAADTKQIQSFTAASVLEFARDDDVAVKSVCGYSNIEFYGFVSAGDMNPAHIIRECLTDARMGMGLADAQIDDESFTASADRLFEERMGISLLWEEPNMSIEDFVKEILRHIDAALYPDRGKLVLRLIRDDYDPETIPVLGKAEIKRVENYTRPQPGELFNSVTVVFWDSRIDQDGTATADDPALIQLLGQPRAATVQYPGFTNHDIAGRVARRDLHAMSNPLLSATVYVLRSIARTLRPGDVFWFEWPKLHAGRIAMRVTHMGLGDGVDNLVKMTIVEDVFMLPEVGVVQQPTDQWDDPVQPPDPAQYRVVAELPYYELVQRIGQANADQQLDLNPYLGFVAAAAARPGAAIDATMSVDAGAGYDDVATAEFCPVAFLAEDIHPWMTEWPITGGVDLDLIEFGTHAQVLAEHVRVDDLDDGILHVGRGVLDTVPTTPYIPAGTPVFFWDIYAGVDETEYAAGETIGVKLLPVSGAGAIELSQADEDNLTFAQRALRPYPPGGWMIGGVAYPSSIELSATLPIGWAHRDRLQQTSGVLEDTTDGDIGPEDGVTYTAEARDASSLVLVDQSAGVGGNSTMLDVSGFAGAALLFSLWSERGGLESYQRHEWVVPVEQPWQGVLDDLGVTAAAAYSSVEYLRAGYVDQPVVRLLGNDAGDTEQDFRLKVDEDRQSRWFLVSDDANEYTVSQWASAIGATSAVVIALYDQSGNSRHATQTDAAKAPVISTGIYSQRSRWMRFDGSNDLLVAVDASITLRDMTAVGVAAMNRSMTTSGARFVLGSDSADSRRLYIQHREESPSQFAVRVGDSALQTSGSEHPAFFHPKYTHVLSVREDAGAVTGRFDGIEYGAGSNSVTNTPLSLRIGAFTAIDPQPWLGDIGTVVLFDTALSDSALSDIERHLYKTHSVLAAVSIDETLTDPDGIDAASIFGAGPDLAVTNEAGQVYLYENDGSGGFTRHTVLGSTVTDAKNEGLVLVSIGSEWHIVVLDQFNGEMRIYGPDSAGVYDGTWSGGVIRDSRPNLQDAQVWDIDGSGEPQIVYTWEGDTGSNGGVHILKYAGTGDPLDSANWTDYVLRTHPGAWWLVPNRRDFAGNGRSDIVFTSRDSRNNFAVPGIYLLEEPASNPLDGAWDEVTIESAAVDWLHIDAGDFFGNDETTDLVAIDHGDGSKVYLFDSSAGWARTDVTLNHTVTNTIGPHNVINLGYKAGGRDAWLVSGDGGTFAVEWVPALSAWQTIGGTGAPQKMDDRLLLLDLDGDGEHELVGVDSMRDTLSYLIWRR
ncbi:MAG TPA: phage tail protein [Azoarcus taiwanensis]|nr:phage tail protein [Rhodocyclaceae bacterium]HRQ59607.1 phage tail protein [Azoarcus taiwanensis]